MQQEQLRVSMHKLQMGVLVSYKEKHISNDFKDVQMRFSVWLISDEVQVVKLSILRPIDDHIFGVVDVVNCILHLVLENIQKDDFSVIISKFFGER